MISTKLFNGQPGLMNFKVHILPPHLTAPIMSKKKKKTKKEKIFCILAQSGKASLRDEGTGNLKDGLSIPGMVGGMLAGGKAGRWRSKSFIQGNGE